MEWAHESAGEVAVAVGTEVVPSDDVARAQVGDQANVNLGAQRRVKEVATTGELHDRACTRVPSHSEEIA